MARRSPSGAALALCPRSGAVGWFRRQCLCIAGRPGCGHSADFGQHRQGEMPRLPDRRSASPGSAQRQLPQPAQHYSADDIANTSGEKILGGTVSIHSELNQTETDAIPISAALPTMSLRLRHHRQGRMHPPAHEYRRLATAMVHRFRSGMSALSGNDGIHAMVRSLSSAQPVRA